jgi:hypothetical protein
MGDPVWEESSPDGRILVRWVENAGRMSHVIRTPEILDTATGDTILRLGDSGYDAEIVWSQDGGFELALRHYWRPETLRLKVDRAGGTFRIAGAGGESAPHPLLILSRFIEAHFTAGDAAREAEGRAAANARTYRLARQQRSGKRALWLLLALVAGAALLALFGAR